MNLTQPHAGGTPLMKPTRGQLSGLIIVVGTVLAFVAYFKIANWPADDLVIPNEKAVAMGMLAQKFVGPGYFHQGPSDPRTPAQAGEIDIFLTPASAEAQVPGIVAERHLSPEAAAKLHRLIVKLTEPPPSRLFDERINLARLNLSLDAMK